MPKAQRKPEEVEAVKQAMLDAAIDIITEHGYEGFSMRRLGRRMGMAAKTLYNYFLNKDEIYLHVLMRGFDLLYAHLLPGYEAHEDPFQKLKAMTRGFIDFGVHKANYYDIMLTWYVPKYNDFVGTPLEPLASRELRSALKTADLFIKVIRELAGRYGHLDPANARLDFIQLLVGLHGTVSLHNNTILSYLHARPDEVLNTLSTSLVARFEPDKRLGKDS